ncbi:cell division ATP-binding protein FtsE [Kingella potus]|uniref:cell division ATP-binding protein FtsE n=1 Tax=Kingella potus TaxID=265175 RepID=UPI001FD3996E|nr:ATP-binding cassette domain-containing protein [Kingella potus]UOP01946.1 ATP-binding cassette domain-containing protein [Kingella potus]
MIRFEQVSKTYRGGFQALKNVSFEIDKGEMIFVAGHSGAGKSTVLKLIAAITRPTSGKVWMNGQDTGRLDDNKAGFLRQHIGIVFQDHKILFDRNVLHNVLLPLQIAGYGYRAEAEKRARTAIAKVGLGDREAADPVTLSGGEQQRLCIARAVVCQPGILIADEPSANLDRAYALDIMELFKTFHEAGTTVIVAAHDETLMADYGHRILRLQEGRFAA